MSILRHLFESSPEFELVELKNVVQQMERNKKSGRQSRRQLIQVIIDSITLNDLVIADIAIDVYYKSNTAGEEEFVI
jgi:hypothetical protein